MRTLDQLTAAASRLGVRITPTVSKDETAPNVETITLSAIDANTLTRTARSTAFSSIETNQIVNLLHRANIAGPATLVERSALRLAQAIDQLVIARDRKTAIDSGRFTGPVSASEALRMARRPRH